MDVLTAAGWTVCGTGDNCTRLTRPGKTEGVSASVDANGVLYVFSSSVAGFDPSEPYAPFAVYTIVEHQGDYVASAKALAKRYGITNPASVVWDSADPLAEQTPPNTPDCLPASDLGNARRLVHYHGGDLRHVPGLGWHVWCGTHWRPDATGEAMRRAKDTVERIHHEASPCRRRDLQKQVLRWAITSESAARLACLLDVASTEAAIVLPAEHLDANPWRLTVANGTLDLRTGDLLPHDRADLVTRVSPVAYDPTATCPVFD